MGGLHKVHETAGRTRVSVVNNKAPMVLRAGQGTYRVTYVSWSVLDWGREKHTGVLVPISEKKRC